MSLDTKVKNLIINTNMTKEQYEAVDDKSNQLFFVEDSSVVDVPAPEENQSGYLHTDGVNLTWKEVESGGDYLPLSGGTMSGDIAFGTDAAIGANYLDGLLIKRYLVGRWTDLYGMNSSTITPMTDATKDLGWSNERWRRLYATKLNNGADLTIPTEGGTLARVEDINAIGGDGVEGQVLTKTADGMVWQNASGGGSSSQVNELPDASLNAGKVVQYVGASTDTLTNGYFYKAEQFDPLTAEITNFEQSEFTEVSVEVGDFNLFVEKFGDAYGTYILEADDMFSWYIKKPDGTYDGSAPISYGINITVDGELQTTADAPLGAAAGNLEITIVYAASGGFAWKNIEVQKVDIKKQLPSLSGGAGNFLMTDGVDLYWDSVITPSSYAMKNRAGIIRPSSTYGTTMTSIQYLAAEVKTPAQYEAANNQMFVSKGTLDNVLESYMLAPVPPADNGTYVLRATVVDGVVTTEWVSEA